jgi:hypothetical protein
MILRRLLLPVAPCTQKTQFKKLQNLFAKVKPFLENFYLTEGEWVEKIIDKMENF